MTAQSTSFPDGIILRWRGPLTDAEMADLVASHGEASQGAGVTGGHIGDRW